MPQSDRDVSAERSAAWSPADSHALYRVDSWGAPYFFVNDAGHVAVRVDSEKGTRMQIDVVEVVEELRNRGVQFPMLLRFQDILRGQVKRLNKAFEAAISQFGYPGDYRTGDRIEGIHAADDTGCKVFHAGTQVKDGHVVTAGGRVLCVCALGETVAAARQQVYRCIDRIKWPDMYCRRDIGYRAVAREEGEK